MKYNAKKTFSKIGFALFITTVIVYLIQILLSKIFINYAPNVANSGWFTYILLGISFYLIGFPLCSFLVKTIPDSDNNTKSKYSVKQVLVLFLISYSLMILTNILTLVLLYCVSLLKGTPPVNSPIASVVSNSNLLGTFLFIGIFSPIVEEILFRKILLNKLKRYGDKVAIITTALLFGLFHGNFSQFFYAVVLGLIFAYITLKTGTIKYSITLHILINMMGSFVGSLVLGNKTLTLIYATFILIFVISGFILLIKNRNKISLSKGATVLPKSSIFRTTCLNAGMILYFTFNIILMFYLLLK